MTRLTHQSVAALANEHLDDAAATRWLSLLRPAVRLVPAAAAEPVVARLGGTPALPPHEAWPEWEGRGPLSFVAELDLAALAATGLEHGLGLPHQGRLLAFYFDDPDGTGEMVFPGDPDSAPGARLLHVLDTPPVADAAVELTAVPTTTWPDGEHPALERVGLEELPDDLVDALGALLDEERGTDAHGHQVGGWAQPVQGSVEYEAAQWELGDDVYDEEHTDQVLAWRPLLQVDSDEAAGTSWGDAGCLYWLSRTDGTTPPPLERTGFTWQCS